MKRNFQSIITRLKTKVDYSALIKKGAVWKDPSFSYSDDAFYFPKYTNQGQPFQNPSTYQIDRPKNRNAKLSLFGNQKQPGPLDIRQGQLGDCYFLGSCSAITEYQQRVMNAFITQEFNSADVIVVRGGELLYDMAPSSNGLWVVYLEKVWAKVMGNFEVIEGDWSEEVMQFLTGAPTLTYMKDYSGFTSADDVWNVVSNSDNARYIIMAGTPGIKWNSQCKIIESEKSLGNDGKYKGQYYASQFGFQKRTMVYFSQPLRSSIIDTYSIAFYSESYQISANTVNGDNGKDSRLTLVCQVMLRATWGQITTVVECILLAVKLKIQLVK
eukprot:403341400